MKKLFVTIGFLLFILLTQAQNPSFQWGKRAGSTHSDYGNSVTCDAYGNVYTTGSFTGTVDFDPGPGLFNRVSYGCYDAFVFKLDRFGNFKWATSISANAVEGNSIKVDSLGNVCIVGRFSGVGDFNTGPGVCNLDGSIGEIFILKLDSLGSFLWAVNTGGCTPIYANERLNRTTSLTLDNKGYIYIVGYFEGVVDFDSGIGIFNLSSPSIAMFIEKLNPLGSFMWARGFSSTDVCMGNSISLDKLGGIYATGLFSGTTDFDPGLSQFNITSLGPKNIFISKLDSAGNFVWAKNIDSFDPDEGGAGLSIIPDENGNTYTTGYFRAQSDFDPGGGTYYLTPFQGDDIFILKLDPMGNLDWVKSFDGTGYDYGNSIELDALGNIYSMGHFGGKADFDPGLGQYYITSAGLQDIFISKLDPSGNFLGAKSIGGVGQDVGNLMCLDPFGNIYCTGYFNETMDFDPDPSVFNLTSAGEYDIFIDKVSSYYLGIDGAALNSSLAGCYPNPSNGLFNIELTENAQIIITNTLDQVLSNKSLLAGNHSIDLKNEANGIYFIKAISGSKHQTVKVIKL